MMAFFIPAAFVLLCFVKKLTVIGIKGNTQGVNKAAKPDKNAIKNMVKSPRLLLLSSSVATAVTSSIITLDGVTFTSVFELITLFLAVVSTTVSVTNTSFGSSFITSVLVTVILGSVKVNFLKTKNDRSSKKKTHGFYVPDQT